MRHVLPVRLSLSALVAAHPARPCVPCSGCRQGRRRDQAADGRRHRYPLSQSQSEQLAFPDRCGYAARLAIIRRHAARRRARRGSPRRSTSHVPPATTARASCARPLCGAFPPTRRWSWSMASAGIQAPCSIYRVRSAVAPRLADLNSTPISAIDHIEVLRDGASAQYGSDAIAGVINIVLKGAAGAGTNEASITAGRYSAGGRQAVAGRSQPWRSPRR